MNTHIDRIKKVLVQKKRELTALIVVLVVFWIVSFIPYLNILFSPLLMYVVVLLFATVVFRLSAKAVLLILLGNYVVGLVFTIANFYFIEDLSSFAFITLIWAVFLLLLRDARK